MKEAKHTATPYEVRDGGIYGDNFTQLVARFSESENPNDLEEIANGEFLLRACNSHDALVAACEFAKAQIRWGAGKKALPILRAALAEAKEKP